MYIGEVSDRTGLSVKAIRLYEEKGLIRTPARIGRYRVYTETDIELLLLIKEAKTFGVTLNQLKGVIQYTGEEVDWTRIGLFLADIKQSLIEQQNTIHSRIESVERCMMSISSCPNYTQD